MNAWVMYLLICLEYVFVFSDHTYTLDTSHIPIAERRTVHPSDWVLATIPFCPSTDIGTSTTMFKIRQRVDTESITVYLSRTTAQSALFVSS